jgi:hypothetical protein
MQTKNWGKSAECSFLTFIMLKPHLESLKVACISPVVWNKQAFDNLVVGDDTKELVKALVTNQLDAEKATDLMDGKGNGLVILLHGSANLSH